MARTPGGGCPSGSQPRGGNLEAENADDRVAECPGFGVLDLCDCVAAPQLGELWRGRLEPGDEISAGRLRPCGRDGDAKDGGESAGEPGCGGFGGVGGAGV